MQMMLEDGEEVVVERDGVGDEGHEDLDVDEGGGYETSSTSKCMGGYVHVGLELRVVVEASPQEVTRVTA